MAQIHVDEEAIARLKEALLTAGNDYKDNLSKLKNLIEDITRGDIQGDPATQLLTKFQEKSETFNGVQQSIDEAADAMGIKLSDFTSKMGELKAGMR